MNNYYLLLLEIIIANKKSNFLFLFVHSGVSLASVNIGRHGQVGGAISHYFNIIQLIIIIIGKVFVSNKYKIIEILILFE